jgi:hypothetical protein
VSNFQQKRASESEKKRERTKITPAILRYASSNRNGFKANFFSRRFQFLFACLPACLLMLLLLCVNEEGEDEKGRCASERKVN